MIGIDVFSGAGGMSYGAKVCGIDVQVVVESDSSAVETYSSNFECKNPIQNIDIRKFKKIPILNDKGEQLILFGGPPCQGFSTSNQKTRNKFNKTNWLFEEFLRVAKIYKPEWIVFENVKGILETEKGIFIKYILKSLEELGYRCRYEILNASDYGVPQFRNRFFIVANKLDVDFSFPEASTKKVVTVAQAFQDLPNLENGASCCIMPYRKKATTGYAKLMRNGLSSSSNHLVTRNSKLVLERYQHIPQGGNWESIPDSLMTNYTDKSRCHTGIYKRLDKRKSSVVIGNYRKNMLIHPLQNRGLSVREAARLQSFPDSFVFKGSIGYQQQQVGNAVPPLLANAIFKKIKQTCND